MTHFRFSPHWLALALALTLTLAACTVSPTTTPTATPLLPTLTPLPPTRTATATQTPTPAPTDTPAPTITPTPYPPERLAFIENDGLVLVNSDGTNRERLDYLDGYFTYHHEGGSTAAGVYLAFSPDGRYLAFDGAKDGKSGTFLVNLVEKTVSDPIEETFEGISWAPDSKYMVLSKKVWYSESSRFNLFLYDVETAQLIQLTHDDAYDLYPSWSPDGEWIAFFRTTIFFLCIPENNPGCSDSLYLIRPNGSDLRLLTQDVYYNFTPPHWTPDWSPNGQWLSVLNAEREASLVLVSTGEVKPLGMVLCQYPDCYDRPTWSPDSNRLLFAGYTYGQEKVYTILPDGAGVTSVTQTQSVETQPVWSRSGRFLAFNCYDPQTAKGSICVTHADGSHPTYIPGWGRIYWLSLQQP